MSFWDHLDVLRGTLFRSIGAIVLVSIFFLAIPERLFKAVLWPTTPDFILYKWLGLDFSMTLINIEVSAQFFVHLKISILDNEKKAVRKAFGMSSFLFYLGVLVGYFIVLPVCLMFFMNYTVSDAVQNTISLGSYISLFTSMVFLIGLLFEFPTVVLVLSSMGILTRKQLKGFRKSAFVVILILAAFITPSDPFSMFVLSIPLYGLYEFSILVCKPDTPSDDDLAE